MFFSFSCQLGKDHHMLCVMLLYVVFVAAEPSIVEESGNLALDDLNKVFLIILNLEPKLGAISTTVLLDRKCSANYKLAIS